jgi:hypothetical protein
MYAKQLRGAPTEDVRQVVAQHTQPRFSPGFDIAAAITTLLPSAE